MRELKKERKFSNGDTFVLVGIYETHKEAQKVADILKYGDYRYRIVDAKSPFTNIPEFGVYRSKTPDRGQINR